MAGFVIFQEVRRTGTVNQARCAAPPGRAGGMTVRMLAVSWDTVQLFVHVLAATIWVGGQLTLAALVPVLRRFGAGVPRAAARRFNQVAWTAFAVLLVTGVWNIVAVRGQIATTPATGSR